MCPRCQNPDGILDLHWVIPFCPPPLRHVPANPRSPAHFGGRVAHSAQRIKGVSGTTPLHSCGLTATARSPSPPILSVISAFPAGLWFVFFQACPVITVWRNSMVPICIGSQTAGSEIDDQYGSACPRSGGSAKSPVDDSSSNAGSQRARFAISPSFSPLSGFCSQAGS